MASEYSRTIAGLDDGTHEIGYMANAGLIVETDGGLEEAVDPFHLRRFYVTVSGIVKSMCEDADISTHVLSHPTPPPLTRRRVSTWG